MTASARRLKVLSDIVPLPRFLFESRWDDISLFAAKGWALIHRALERADEVLKAGLAAGTEITVIEDQLGVGRRDGGEGRRGLMPIRWR